ncbi:MAG: hypothetical protein HGB30_01700 [Holophagaceae bacterium]|nr:hypothetical protein [Holophagaceae bacterium]
MMRPLLLVGLVLLGLSQARAQSTRPITAGKSQMAPVGVEVRLIEEESLPLDPTLQTSGIPSSGGSRSVAAYIEDSGPKDNGIKLYRFTVAPGETLATQVQCDPVSVVTQRWGLLSGPDFTPAASSKSQITRVNRFTRQQRSTRIEFMNTEDRPFPILLIVHGTVGNPYKIHISRTAAK